MLTGGGGTGEDAAALLAASWHAARRAALAAGGLQQFHFRQFLFARQARLLLQLQRPGEVWRPSASPLVTCLSMPPARVYNLLKTQGLHLLDIGRAVLDPSFAPKSQLIIRLHLEVCCTS